MVPCACFQSQEEKEAALAAGAAFAGGVELVKTVRQQNAM